MKKIMFCFFAVVSLLSASLFSSCSSDDDNKEESKGEALYRKAVVIDKKHDTALLLCSFGSTYAQPQATYDKIIADYQAAYPNTDIYLSFTSRTIVSRVYNQLHKVYAYPSLWLSAIGNVGYKNVYVQSLHIIPGEEYLSLMNTDVKKNFMVPFETVKVAKSACLLEAEEDVEAVAKILYNYYKPALDNGEVVALMGHGNPDTEYTHANLRYDELELALQALSGKQNIFVGTVDWGQKMFSHVRDGIISFAKANGKEYKDVIVNLSPLMSIAGDHAQNDLLGSYEDGQTWDKINPYEDDEDAEYSWILKLQKLGFSINKNGSQIGDNDFNVVGLADHSEIRKIYLSHMVKAIENATSWKDHLGD